MEGSRKKEKWNRLVDAFSLKGTSYVVPQYPQVEPEQMAEELSEISETVWGMYAFAREPLEGRFTREQKCHYIAKANACGREWADQVAKEYGTNDPKLLAERMGMKVLEKKTPTGGGIVLFAQFVQPDEITIFTDCIAKAQRIYRACGCPLLESEKLTSVLLAHELFHAVEERHEKEIYTLEIEGQKPDGVIEIDEYGRETYMWYYNDLKSNKRGDCLSYSIDVSE